jgi:hypothetical protein
MRKFSCGYLFVSVFGTGLVILGPPIAVADYRLVVELRPDQQLSQLEQTTADVFDGAVEIEPMFAGIDPDDDPLGMGNIYTVYVDTGADIDAESSWDIAYNLRDSGDFLRVVPDNEDVLVDPTARSVLCRPGVDDDKTADPAWSLLAVNADKAWELTPPANGKRFGEGVRICHLDTGWTEHVDLDEERIDLASDYDVLEKDDNAEDPLNYRGSVGHGTSTGSVIVSSGGIGEEGGVLPPGKITGVAPKATLVPIRTVKSVIQFLDSDVAKAVRRSVDAQCDVISMSLGGGAFFGLERALMDAVRHEVIPVAAAGNCVRFVVAPALYDATIAAGATNVDENPWKGSSRGRAVDISAPGERVHVAWKKSTDADSTGTARSDGTSYATAMTAGAAALWIAYHGEEAIRDAYGSRTRKDLFLEILEKTANTPDGWNSKKYGAGILDTAALLASPLGEPDNTARVASVPVPNLELLSRITERDPDELNTQLQALFGDGDYAESMDRFGSELLHIAVQQPETLESMLDHLGSDAGSGAAARRTAVSLLEPMGSRRLMDSLSPVDTGAAEQNSSAPQAAVTRRVLLEVDRMEGTQPVLTEQTIDDRRVSLADIYRAAGIELRIVEDQTDIARVESLRLADLHSVLNSNRSLVPEAGEEHIYMLVVSEDEDAPDTLGIMFDFGENDANNVPRESFAVFESPHANMPGGISRELLLTTAHELAHVFNLHHSDWDGSNFTRSATVESYSLTDTVLWRLSDASVEHLSSHPDRLVSPGTGNLPFGLISQSHANQHKPSPRENFSIAPEDTLSVSRGSSIDASAAIRTKLAPVNDISADSTLRLQIKTAKDIYIVGEAITLAVAVVNAGDSPQDVIPLLSPEYGFLNVLIRGPGQEEFRPYKAPVLREARMAGLSRTLAPDDIMIDDARIFFSSDGWTFAVPGEYEIQATFPADAEFSNDVIRSVMQHVSVQAPGSEPAAGASRLLFSRDGLGLGDEQGLYLYMQGGDHLQFGASQLRQMVSEYPQAEQADPAKVALANEALQPTIDQARGDRPEPRLDEAQFYLRGLQDIENVPGVGLKRVQRRLIEALEKDGRDMEARSLSESFGEDSQISKDLDFLDQEILERSFE